MENKQVKALIERMRSDAAFRKRVLAVEDLDARMELIEQEGFDCKLGDVQLYLRHYSGGDGGEAIVLTEKGGCRGIYYGFCF